GSGSGRSSPRRCPSSGTRPGPRCSATTWTDPARARSARCPVRPASGQIQWADIVTDPTSALALITWADEALRGTLRLTAPRPAVAGTAELAEPGTPSVTRPVAGLGPRPVGAPRKP